MADSSLIVNVPAPVNTPNAPQTPQTTLNTPTSNTITMGGNPYANNAPATASNPNAPTSTPTITNTIDSSVLTPQTPIPYTTPNPTPIPSVSGLDTQVTPQLTETPEEQQESDLSTQLQGLNDQLVGKSAYTAEQNTENGVDTLTQQQNDLSSQLTSLKDQASAIPQQLQLDATGRGITTTGLAPVQTAALRNNSIQALSVSAMLDATKGLLASAQQKAALAVSAKYDPIQEQIDAATANLKLIQNDPQTSLDDKNRAAAQADALANQKAQLATDKQNATDVLNQAITAAKNGADAQTLAKIQQAPDGATALAIATQAGYGNSDVNDLATKYPDAGIQPGDTLQQAQAKVLQSPTYTNAQKSALLSQQASELDIATKQQALATAAANSSPANIQTAVNSLTDYNGTKYYTTTDMTGMDAATKQAFQAAAQAAGAKPLSPKDGDALSSITAAQQNLEGFQAYISGAQNGTTGVLLPSNWLGQPQAYANVKFNQFLQTNGQLAAYSSWAAQIPTLLSALKGAGSGSGGSSRLFGTITALLPSDTDTLPTAMQKLQTINTILDNGASSILGTKSNTYNGITLPGGSTGSASSSYNGINLPN